MLNLMQILNSLDLPGAEWVGLREVREKQVGRRVRNGQPEENQQTLSHGVMVEVLSQGQFAYAATPRLDLQGVRTAAHRALGLAQHGSAFKLYSFTAAQRPKATGRFFSPCVSRHLPVREVVDILVQASAHMRVSPQIIDTEANLMVVETETQFVSSNGSDIQQNFAFITTDFAATAQEGSHSQRRSNNGGYTHSYQGGFEFLADEGLLNRAQVVGEQAVELLGARDCPMETTSLVLAPDQMYLQIHESVGHPLEIDRILGDERNYAGSSFVKLSDFGVLQYGSELMNIIFDPHYSGEFASYAFDDTGNPATPEMLIHKGRLVRGLGSLESQARAHIPGVANQRSCLWNRPPIDRMANINLQAGASSRDEIFAAIERGVYMESNRSWSIDDTRHKFQFGCEYAKLIEDGRLTHTVRNPNYRSTTPHFWRNLTAVGDAQTCAVYGSPFCGKGEPHQAIRVGHAAPLCRFDNIEVFGGAK